MHFLRNIFTLIYSLITFIVFGQDNIRIPTENLLNPNEPSISIHPIRSNYWEVGTNIDHRFSTFNAGKTWNFGTFSSKYGIYGDPVMHFVFNGELFTAHLSRNPNKTHPKWFDKIVVNRFYVNGNNDTFQESFPVGRNGDKVQDKPWLHSDKYSEYQGNVYVTWTEFDAYKSADTSHKSRIKFSKYTPESKTFSDAVVISVEEGDCEDGPNTMEGATSTTDLDGTVYVAWAGKEKIWFTRSWNQGEFWIKPEIIAEQKGGWTFDYPNIYRVNALPFLKYDPTHQHLILCWGDQSEGNHDIWIQTSETMGDTWNEKVKVNQSPNSRCFFPNVAVDEITGNIYVAFYDQRHSSLGHFVDVYLTVLNSQGKFLYEQRITPHSYGMPGSDFFFGDYLDIDIKNGRGVVAYTVYDQFQSFIEVYPFLTQHTQVESKDTVVFNFQKEKDYYEIWSKADYPFKATVQVVTINSKGKIKKKNWKFSNKKLHQKEVFHKMNKKGAIFETNIKKLKRLK